MPSQLWYDYLRRAVNEHKELIQTVAVPKVMVTLNTFNCLNVIHSMLPNAGCLNLKYLAIILLVYIVIITLNFCRLWKEIVHCLPARKRNRCLWLKKREREKEKNRERAKELRHLDYFTLFVNIFLFISMQNLPDINPNIINSYCVTKNFLLGEYIVFSQCACYFLPYWG